MTRMIAPYSGICAECGQPIARGDEIDADPDSVPVHVGCLEPETADEGWWDQ